VQLVQRQHQGGILLRQRLGDRLAVGAGQPALERRKRQRRQRRRSILGAVARAVPQLALDLRRRQGGVLVPHLQRAAGQPGRLRRGAQDAADLQQRLRRSAAAGIVLGQQQARLGACAQVRQQRRARLVRERPAVRIERLARAVERRRALLVRGGVGGDDARRFDARAHANQGRRIAACGEQRLHRLGQLRQPGFCEHGPLDLAQAPGHRLVPAAGDVVGGERNMRLGDDSGQRLERPADVARQHAV
jgi:hypothetical protein